jgi:hypothetical protein
VRTSAAEAQLDQQLLDSMPLGLTRDAVEERVEQIRVRRDKEIATGVHGDPGVERTPQKRRFKLRPQISNETIQKSLLKGQHLKIVRESLAHEAMKCFRISGPHTEYTLMSAVNVNVCPGFRNFGNTCWLNACLQCIMQTSALRAHFLREESGMSALDVAVKRVCTCYWALARTPRHSVIAPVDVLTALILQWPQLGGALQQDVSEVLQCFHLASVAGLELPADGLAVSVDGIVLAQLKNETLQKDILTLQALWDCIGVGWKNVSTFPACLIVSFPTVYELPDGGYRYSRLALTDVDVPIQVVGKNPATYSFRAYVQHKHHGEPSSTSRVAGHYVAHFQNAHVWYTADDTATTLKRQQGHALPVAAFFELVRENVSDDWALVDPGAMHREPTWLQSALGVALGPSDGRRVALGTFRRKPDEGGASGLCDRDERYR